MVDGGWFDELEAMARKLRRSKLPFGGIQLICCGDFLQLPPVSKGDDIKSYAFQARTWKTCMVNCACFLDFGGAVIAFQPWLHRRTHRLPLPVRTRCDGIALCARQSYRVGFLAFSCCPLQVSSCSKSAARATRPLSRCFAGSGSESAPPTMWTWYA